MRRRVRYPAEINRRLLSHESSHKSRNCCWLLIRPRRLDIGAADYTHQQFLEQRRQQRAVLLISTELDEILALSDRIFVMYRGGLTEATAFRDGPVQNRTVDDRELAT